MRTADEIAEQVLRDHVIRGYDCSCGAQINSHDRHLVQAAVEATLRAS